MALGNNLYARRSVGFCDGEPYKCLKSWPEGSATQCGGKGVVFTTGSLEKALTDPQATIDALTGKTDHYRTSFFEVFIEIPSTFIRGEGASIEAAEESAWKKWQRISSCEEHLFQRKFKNGYAKCQHCGLGMSVFPPV